MCRECQKKTDEIPQEIRHLATNYAKKNNVIVVICKCAGWDFYEIDRFDFETQTAIEIITP